MRGYLISLYTFWGHNLVIVRYCLKEALNQIKYLILSLLFEIFHSGFKFSQMSNTMGNSFSLDAYITVTQTH